MLFDPEGDCIATSTHSLMSWSSTGREKSRRLRTARVVVSNWSASNGRSGIIRPYYGVMASPLDDLVTLLDLEVIEVNIFRGFSPEENRVRVFGG